MTHSIEYNEFEQKVDGRLHDFHVSSDWKLMKNIKVIQEHITDKLQTKSLEFTYEFIGNYRS